MVHTLGISMCTIASVAAFHANTSTVNRMAMGRAAA